MIQNMFSYYGRMSGLKMMDFPRSRNFWVPPDDAEMIKIVVTNCNGLPDER